MTRALPGDRRTRWRVLARKEVRDAHRSRTLWTTLAAFVVLFGGVVYSLHALNPDPPGGDAVVAALAGMVRFVVPLFAALSVYDDVAGERESGRVRLLLGLPYSRGDVVLGFFAARTGVVWLVTAAGIAVALLVAAAMGTVADPVAVLALLVVTTALVLASVGTALAVSAATASTSLAAAVAMGLVFTWLFLWNFLPGIAAAVVDGAGLPFEITPGMAQTWSSLGPQQAFLDGLGWLVDLPAFAGAGAGDPAGFVVLAGWTLVPLALGYRRFDGADL